jgi:hypothetical protein
MYITDVFDRGWFVKLPKGRNGREMVKKFEDMRKRLAVRYFGFGLPRSKPQRGRVLVHNHVMHTIDMSNGVNGFRCWTQKKAPDLVQCRCGWSGLPHYRIRGLGSDKAYTWAQIDDACKKQMASYRKLTKHEHQGGDQASPAAA